MSHGRSSDATLFVIRPRRGGALRVLIIARISTVHQDPRSLADQIGLCKAYVTARYGGAVEFVIIQGQGSGEHLDRRELAEAEELIESGTLDLIVVEDLGRICRRNRALDICEMAEDADTRLIAINDHIDTAQGNWRLSAFFASFKHEMANTDTAARIRRSLRERFKTGGVIQFTLYGYVKPPGAKTDAALGKDPAAQPVYEQMATMLEAGASYCEVADWLNDHGVSPGPYARSRRWTGHLVAQTIHNPILKGVRVRNDRVSKRVNKSGKRKSVKAPPAERLERACPHLAFLEPARYDRLITLLKNRNAKYARTSNGRPDARANVPKKRTTFPGQHAVCGVCGRLYYWGGHGQADHMMCAGNRECRCWNAVSFDAVAGGRRIAEAVMAAVEALPGYDAEFEARVRTQAAARRGDREAALARLGAERAKVAEAIANLADAVETRRMSEALVKRLDEREDRLRAIDAELADLRGRSPEVPDLPPIGELKARARASVGSLVLDDPEFGRVMRVLVPELVIYPFKDIDSGRVVARARLAIDLAGLLPPGLAADAVGLIRTVVWVDLFDPPERVARMAEVVARRPEFPNLRALARALDTHLPTVQRALKLHRMLQARGLAQPYELLTEPPAQRTQFRRHLHRRFRFEPLDGFPRWPAD